MPTKLTSYAVEKSTFAVVCAFTDEDAVAATPSAVTWSLVDDSGTVINSRQDVSASPAASVTIVLSGDDLQLLVQTNTTETRYLEISATVTTNLGSDLPLKDRAEFKVLNLESIS